MSALRTAYLAVETALVELSDYEIEQQENGDNVSGLIERLHIIRLQLSEAAFPEAYR